MSESELAWEVMDEGRRWMTRGERLSVSVCLSSHDYFDAIVTILASVVRGGHSLPPDLAHRIDAWSRRYAQRGDYDRIKGLVASIT